MRSWGKDLGMSLGLAYLVATVVWIAGGNDIAQGITVAIAWPIALIGAREARARGWRPDRAARPQGTYQPPPPVD